MIEATCAACGTLNRIAEGDVPPGAKFLTCSSCKSRVALPLAGAAKPGGIPPIKPAAIPPARAKTPPPIPGGTPDLADLPAPKRNSPLAGLEPAKPAPKSGLDLADLPAPKVPATKQSTTPIDLDDLLPADLPAPKAKSTGISDLPAPKGKPAAPVAKPPERKQPVSVEIPARGAPISDLPAPKAKSPGIVDLPAPKGPAGISDLPAPKGKPAAAATATARPAADALDIVDLPAPKGISDLPAPKPGANNDLPAPKGFFDDLPQPAKASKQQGGSGSAGVVDLPAPKGFFDDLPQPAKPAGGSASAAPDLLAPKGFFDDLPQPAKPAGGGGGGKALEDDKGFFDDLPQPAKPAPASGGGGNVFDDLPNPTQGVTEVSSSDIFGASGSNDLDLAPSTSPPLELDLGPSPELDLGHATSGNKADAHRADFSDLDLSSPSPQQAPVSKAGINIKASTPSSAKPKTMASGDGAALGAIPAAKGSELKLDLEDEAERTPAAKAEKRDAPKRKAAAAAATEDSAESIAKRRKRMKLVAGAVLGLAILGSGGAYMYKRHADAVARESSINEQLVIARAAIHDLNPNHWQRAANAAGAVLEIDPKQVEAIGLRAEALLGGAFDTGVGGEGRIAQGRAVLGGAVEAGVTGPQLETAQALGMIAANQADRAATKLQAMTARDPKNGFWQLYLGWALVAKGDPAAAVKAFDAALAADPKVKLPALYARGRAKLLLADLDGANADFSAILETNRDHIGAMVGLAASRPASQSSQREADLLAILARKEISTGDPRAVIQAHTLLGDVARAGGRLDVAREQYRQALALSKLDPPSLIGLAEVEIRDSKLDLAADLVQKALSQAGDSPDAMLVAAELYIRQGKINDALALAQKLAARVPPLPAVQRAHLQLVIGDIDDAQSKDDDAIDAWVEGAKLAGDIDLTPMMAAVTKLGVLAKRASDNHDDKKAADYRARADQLLSSLADRAQDDPQLSKTLGAAYLQAGDAVKAEQFLRRAVEMRGNDIETKLELAKALAKLNRTDDALEQLRAAQTLDPSRLDIALEIARTLEAANRTDDAMEAYTKLLANKDVTAAARVHAGRFFARKGDIKRAAEQADPILAVEPENPAGHYLRGEGLLAAGKLDDARKEFTSAVDGDPDPQYLDAQGRAAEASSLAATGDNKFQELALRAYERAIDAAPGMFNPQAGSGRLFILRKEWTKAVAPLGAAYKIDPNNAEVLFNLGVAWQNLGRADDAIGWLNAANSKKANAEAYWRLGQLYQDANRGADMAKTLREATRLGSEQETKTGVKLDWLTEAWYLLGDTEGKLNNISGARTAFEHYLAGNPPPSMRLTEVKRRLATELRP